MEGLYMSSNYNSGSSGGGSTTAYRNIQTNLAKSIPGNSKLSGYMNTVPAGSAYQEMAGKMAGTASYQQEMAGKMAGTAAYQEMAGKMAGTAAYQEMAGKMVNLNLDHNSLKMVNRQPQNAGLNHPAPTSPGFGPPRFPPLNTSMAGGPSMFPGPNSPNFSRHGPPNFPTANPTSGSRLSPTLRLAGPGPGAHITPPPPTLRPPSAVNNGGSVAVSTAGGNNQPPLSEAEAQAAAASSAKVTIFSENGTTYFYNPEESLPSQLSTGQVVGSSLLLPNWSAYSGTLSQIVSMKVRNAAPTALQERDTKVDLLSRQLICHAAADPEANPELPAEVDNFTSLCPLEPLSTSPLHKSSTFGYVTTVYKAVNVKTGQHMCLRRVHGYRLVNTKCMGLVDQWKKMSHSNLVTLRQVFTSKSFGDHSMVFVYDFFPGAETIMARHFSHSQMNSALVDPFNGDTSRPYSQTKNSLLRQQAAAINSTGLLAETLIWNYIIQLTSSLRYIHTSGLACRTLDPTKILVVGRHRLLINCSGIFDVLTFDPNSSNTMAAMSVYQQEDLVSLGRIVLALACNSFLALQRDNLQQSIELVTTNYSTDLRNLIMYLLTNPQRVKSVNDLMPMIGARFYTALDTSLQRNDLLEMELSKEMESGRIVRLLTKLSTVVDRAEFNMDTAWAETGDRYMLKLFRDYLFHQVMEDGRPFLDMAHIITNLNRLDAGIPDMIGLMSRDEQNILVVSYAELKNCLEQSFGEVLSAATAKPKIMA